MDILYWRYFLTLKLLIYFRTSNIAQLSLPQMEKLLKGICLYYIRFMACALCLINMIPQVSHIQKKANSKIGSFVCNIYHNEKFPNRKESCSTYLEKRTNFKFYLMKSKRQKNKSNHNQKYINQNKLSNKKIKIKSRTICKLYLIKLQKVRL